VTGAVGTLTSPRGEARELGPDCRQTIYLRNHSLSRSKQLEQLRFLLSTHLRCSYADLYPYVCMPPLGIAATVRMMANREAQRPAQQVPGPCVRNLRTRCAADCRVRNLNIRPVSDQVVCSRGTVHWRSLLRWSTGQWRESLVRRRSAPLGRRERLAEVLYGSSVPLKLFCQQNEDTVDPRGTRCWNARCSLGDCSALTEFCNFKFTVSRHFLRA
jgi:hypothetical protein